jgi:3-oxoacyl-[acyl-carrier protein] reductase
MLLEDRTCVVTGASRGIGRGIAEELAAHGATAKSGMFGVTRTEMLESVDDEVQADIRRGIPLGRFATVDDLSGVVRFLASGASADITGGVIDVNGGIDL